MKNIFKLSAIILCFVFMMAIMTACGEESSSEPETTVAPTTRNLHIVVPTKPAFVNVGKNGSRSDKPLGFQFEKPAIGEDIVVLKTNMGDIRLRLFPDEAPMAVANFLALVKGGYYDGLIFHRVMNDFMIQGGDPTGTGGGGESVWGQGFGYEYNANLLHYKGALSMAHSSLADSNGSQFFIVQKGSVSQTEIDYYSDNKNQGAEKMNMKAFTKEQLALYWKNGGPFWLDGVVNPEGHTVFGQAFAEDMKVVDSIAAVQTSSDKPLSDVIITKAEIVKYTGK